MHEVSDMYDTYKNRVGTIPFGNALMVKLINKKHSTTNATNAMEFYYNTRNATHVPALDLAYKERYLSRFIIMHGDMKGGHDEMLHNQSICRSTLFEITWGQSMSLLDRECQKTRQERNKKSKKGGKQDGDEEETDGIVQCLLGTDSNLDNQANDDNKSAVLIDTPAFLGMVPTANDDNDDDEIPEPEQEEMDDDNSQQLPRGFDVNSPTNILATAIHQVALARTSTEAAAEGWFESVRAKLRICGICTSTKYQELYGASAEESSPIEQYAGQAINTRIHNNHFRPMMQSTLCSINDYINTLLAGEAQVHPVVLPGLPEDKRPITDFESLNDDQLDCYTVIVTSAYKTQRLCPIHWANKNFEKAKAIGLDSWYYMGLSIQNWSWNTMLEHKGLPTLHKTSLGIILQTFHEGLPHRN